MLCCCTCCVGTFCSSAIVLSPLKTKHPFTCKFHVNLARNGLSFTILIPETNETQECTPDIRWDDCVSCNIGQSIACSSKDCKNEQPVGLVNLINAIVRVPIGIRC